MDGEAYRNSTKSAFVLHISGDYPDPIIPQKTSVIKSLIELTQDCYSHRVLSINRAPFGFADLARLSCGAAIKDPVVSELRDFELGRAISYRAPSRGVFHVTMLKALSERILDLIAKSDAKPALLVGHKLTIEGVLVARLAAALNIPYALTIQGNTDLKILAARPDLKNEFSRIFHGAEVVFAFAPWAAGAVERKLGKRVKPLKLLPCPTELDTPVKPINGGNGLVSLFHLHGHENKNLRGIAKAFQMLRTKAQKPKLRIYGGGTDDDVGNCRAIVGNIPNIELCGKLGRHEVAHTLNQATGFVLPSFRESFGLVFVEALFAGLPIVYPRNAAVDGYFDGFPFAIPVNPRDSNDIARAIATIIEEEGNLKTALANWQTSPHAKQFQRPEIAATFRDGLRASLKAY